MPAPLERNALLCKRAQQFQYNKESTKTHEGAGDRQQKRVNPRAGLTLWLSRIWRSGLDLLGIQHFVDALDQFLGTKRLGDVIIDSGDMKA